MDGKMSLGNMMVLREFMERNTMGQLINRDSMLLPWIPSPISPMS